MLEMILDKRIAWILMGVFAAVGALSKCVVSISLKRLTRAAKDMGKSSHALIRLIRAKYEHACMVSDKVQNIEVFAEKFMYEYRVLGFRLHGWRGMEKVSAWMCPVIGLLGAGAEYAVYGMNDKVLQFGAFGAGAGIFLFLLRLTMDEKYQLEMIHTYMVDYLENVCARRYEKSRELNLPGRPKQREEVPSPKEEPEELPPVMPEPYRMPEPYHAPEQGQPEADVHAAKSLDQEEKNAGTVKTEPVMAKEKAEVSGISEAAAEASEEKEEAKEKKLGPISKEVLIREILEEFLA